MEVFGRSSLQNSYQMYKFCVFKYNIHDQCIDFGYLG